LTNPQDGFPLILVKHSTAGPETPLEVDGASAIGGELAPLEKAHPTGQSIECAAAMSGSSGLPASFCLALLGTEGNSPQTVPARAARRAESLRRDP
jgi:hypothetical protein